MGAAAAGARRGRWSEKGFAGREAELRWEGVVWSAVWRDTGVNFGGSPEEAGEKRAPPGPGCHSHRTLQIRALCCYSYILVTVIWLLLKMRANSYCDRRGRTPVPQMKQ